MKVLPCKCTHEFQDRKFGKGNRAHNSCKPKSTVGKFYRCTVCGNEKQV